jgi:tetratricopeptide (TPR) repeat protein
LTKRDRIAGDRCARAALSAGIRLAAALLWLTGSAAFAQPTPVGTPEDVEANALFAQLLKEPTNVDLNFRYAEAAIKLGNFEGAISALERLLLYNPNFPGVKLQLAELYIRLVSYNAARAYLDQVENAPDATPETHARVQALRDQMDRATSSSKFATNLVVGLRHQSNASAEPAGSDIVAGGVPATLSAVSLGRPGWDAFTGGNVAHTYDLGGATLESNALIYYSKQFEFSSIDSAAVEVNSGPRFDIGGSGASKIFSLRPYALANEVLLGNSQFLWTVGAGLGADRAITERVDVTGFYEFRSEHFSNLTPVPTATDMDAGVHSAGGNLSYQIFDNGNFGLQASYAVDNARQAFASNDSLVLKASYTHNFQLPEKFGVGPLIVTPVLYRIYSWSAAANPAVDPTLIPITREWRYGVTGELALTANLAATAFVIRETIDSNLAADRSSDTQVIVGLRVSY